MCVFIINNVIAYEQALSLAIVQKWNKSTHRLSLT